MADWGKAPHDLPLTSLGLLKKHNDPRFEWLEWRYLKDLEEFATFDWAVLQGGWDDHATSKWVQALETLELDGDAARDLFLLCQQGVAGRAEANEILWYLLTEWGLVDYKNLSRKAMSETRPKTHHQYG